MYYYLKCKFFFPSHLSSGFKTKHYIIHSHSLSFYIVSFAGQNIIKSILRRFIQLIKHLFNLYLVVSPSSSKRSCICYSFTFHHLTHHPTLPIVDIQLRKPLKHSHCTSQVLTCISMAQCIDYHLEWYR